MALLNVKSIENAFLSTQSETEGFKSTTPKRKIVIFCLKTHTPIPKIKMKWKGIPQPAAFYRVKQTAKPLQNDLHKFPTTTLISYSRSPQSDDFTFADRGRMGEGYVPTYGPFTVSCLHTVVGIVVRLKHRIFWHEPRIAYVRQDLFEVIILGELDIERSPKYPGKHGFRFYKKIQCLEGSKHF